MILLIIGNSDVEIILSSNIKWMLFIIGNSVAEII